MALPILEALADLPQALSGGILLWLVLAGIVLALHLSLVMFALASTLYLTFPRLRVSSLEARVDRLGEAEVRGGLPSLLLAAIGTGPAAFVLFQPVHEQGFVAANPFLFQQAMGVVPGLVLGFFMACVATSGALSRGLRGLGILAALGSALSLLLVATFWIENHVIHVDSEVYAALYSRRELPGSTRLLPWRLAFFVSVSLPVWGAWILWLGARRDRDVERRVRVLVIVGLLLVPLTGLGLSLESRTGIMEPWMRLGLAPALVVLGLGWCFSLGGWSLPGSRRRSRWLVGGGLGLLAIGGPWLREGYRLASLEADPRFHARLVDPLAPGGPAAAWRLVLAAGLVAVAGLLVRHARRRALELASVRLRAVAAARRSDEERQGREGQEERGE